MKATGIVRNVDHLGRIVIPIEIRREMGIDVGASMEIYVDGQRIILHKHALSCRICSSSEELVETDREKYVCKSCVACIVELANK